MIWKTEQHGEIECTYHGIAPDGRVIIHVPDKYDPGTVELKVPRTEVVGLEQEQTKVAVQWFGRNV